MASHLPGVDPARSAIAFEQDVQHEPRLLPKKQKKPKRDRHKRLKVTFFRYAYYEPAFRYFVEQVLDTDFLPLPEATKHSEEVGVQNSSDYVCTPFKHILGDFIDALEAGADILIQFGGPCRLGYYGELQESILRDLGYDFTLLNFSQGIEQGYFGFAKETLKVVNPDINIPYGIRQLLSTANMVNRLDTARDYYLANAGFEDVPGSFAKAWANFMDAMNTAQTDHDINQIFRDSMAEMRAIPNHKPAYPIRIGIVGEMFTAIDGRSNLNLDEKLVAMGIEVHRMLNLTNVIIRSRNEANLRLSAAPYLTYNMGPTSTLTIAAANQYANEGFDGLIHAKSAGCTPEIDCEPLLQKISADYEIPVLYLTYDSQTSDTGLDTRLEAFYDMLVMKQAKKQKLSRR